MLYYRLRLLLTIIVVVGITGAIFYFVSLRDYEANVTRFHLQVTAAVATGVQEALYSVTRTAEAPGNAFLIVQLGQNENLDQLARRYGTTLEIFQVVNGFAQDVTTGNGETVVIPVAMQVLDPLRTITVYKAQSGDTLESIAERNIVPLEQLERDNPMLAQRTLLPGDTVFVGLEL
jgi:LysM repeat protein